jgi:hypothetical protein
MAFSAGRPAADSAIMNPYWGGPAGCPGGAGWRDGTGETAAEVIVSGVPTGR